MFRIFESTQTPNSHWLKKFSVVFIIEEFKINQFSH